MTLRVGRLPAASRQPAWTSHNRALCIIATHDERPDGILTAVVVYFQAAVLAVAKEPVPVPVEISQRFAERSARHDLRQSFHQPGAQLIQHRHTVGLPRDQALSRCLLADAMFNRIQMSDEAKRLQRPARLIGWFGRQLVRVQAECLERLDEVTSGMGKAIQRGDAVGGNDSVIAGVAVGL